MRHECGKLWQTGSAVEVGTLIGLHLCEAFSLRYKAYCGLFLSAVTDSPDPTMSSEEQSGYGDYLIYLLGDHLKY